MQKLPIFKFLEGKYLEDKYFFDDSIDDIAELELNDTEANKPLTKFKRVDKKIEPSFNFKDFLSEEDLEKLKSIR